MPPHPTGERPRAARPSAPAFAGARARGGRAGPGEGRGVPRVPIESQPDDTSCGPTALHAVYRYHGDAVALADVVAEVRSLAGGGTLGVLLGNHALARGYRATLYTYNLQVFDPTWFGPGAPDLGARLRAQAEHKRDRRLRIATRAYLEFLDRGGRIRLEDLSPALLRRHLRLGEPILAGLSATWLYRSTREFGPDDASDDVRGVPAGHFVVLTAYDPERHSVRVADPMRQNPIADEHHYAVRMDRLVGAIFLGVLTYDANLLVVVPRRRRDR